MESYIREKFAAAVGLDEKDIFEPNLTLAQIIARSKRLNNSVDLMEAFARMANSLKKDHGHRVRLPAFTLDTPISTVLEAFMQQVELVASTT